MSAVGPVAPGTTRCPKILLAAEGPEALAGRHRAGGGPVEGYRDENLDAFLLPHRFQADGQLSAIEDLNGHVVRLEYEQERPVRVIDASGRVGVDLIEENGTRRTVYAGGDTTACGGWLVVPVELTSYKVKKVRVTTRVAGYEGIDAVGLDTQATDTYAYNAFNQLTGITSNDGSTTTFGYDGNGNQVSKTETPAGGTAQLTQYVYNQDDRLAGIALPNGGANTFEYDANGLRTKKTDSSGTTRYLLDGLSIIAQYAPGGARQAWYTQSLARIDEVLSVVNDDGKHWYQQDALGSIYGLTDSTGALAAKTGYDVFGSPMPPPPAGAGGGQPFGFTGREHDLDAGLVYARARCLNVAAGRWDRPDPLGQLAGPNYYVYVHGRPTAAADPSGLLSTLDAYAMKFPFAFLMLMQDLGVIATTALMVASATVVAVPISEVISNASDDADARSSSEVCSAPRPRRSEGTYYRGLSNDDVNELMLYGQVHSKFMRYGFGGFVEALEYFVLGARNHPAGSDVINWGEVAHGKSAVPSPFVSTTPTPSTARDFAGDGPSPGHVVVEFRTRRVPIGPTPGFGEGEYLFFLLLGEPGETLQIVP